MRVFLAGATGFIGRAAGRSLVAAGHEVTGLARDAAKAALLERDGLRALVGSLDDPGTFLGPADRPEAIVHLAMTWFDGLETVEEAERIATRVLGWTRSLARLAVESGSRLLVFAGSNAPPATGAVARRPVGYDRLLEPSQTWLESASGIPLAVVEPGWAGICAIGI